MLLKQIFTLFNLLLIFSVKKFYINCEENEYLNIFKGNQEVEQLKSVKQNFVYTVIAPGTIKSNRKYTIFVSLHYATQPCLLRISVVGPRFNVTEEILLQPFQSKSIEFYPHKLDHHLYELMAEGIEGCSFKDIKQLLEDVDTGPNIFIQTDKAIYKPLDLLQFRILLLDEHTKPLSIQEPIQVDILDAKENIVKSFKDVRFIMGVFTNSFQLSERPVMGTWLINVSIGGLYSYTTAKTIKVKEYVLPKFVVHIKTPIHVIVSDAYITAIIYGKYNFGKYVQGVATVILSDMCIDNGMQQELKVDVKTMAKVQFPLTKVEGLMENHCFKITVSLRENLTGITQSESIKLILHDQRYNIIVNDNDFEFNGLVPKRLKVHIQFWNGAVVIDSNSVVTLKHGNREYETYMDENGEATFELEQAEPDAEYLVSFKDSKLYIPNVYTSVAEENGSVYYCKLQLINKSLRVGTPVQIKVSSSENIPYIIYAVVGHGNIIHMQHKTLSPNQKSYTIYLKPTIEMLPLSYIIVYYSDNGLLRYNEMELAFPIEFKNQISLITPQEVKPGQEITIKLKAEPMSLVGILAVDIGVYTLDPTYDLNPYEILYNLLTDKSYILRDHIQKGEHLISGLIILTNLKRNFDVVKRRNKIRKSDVEFTDYRTYFPDVWIFQNINVNETDTKLSFKLPDSITTYRLTAFSINEKSGLGILTTPLDITAIKPFFISLNLPYSVIYGEIVAIPILVFNYHNEPLDSIIIMRNEEQEFEFMDTVDKKCRNQQQQLVKSVVPTNDGKVFTFYIKPLKVGNINLRITATNYLYTDAVHQRLKVDSEGIAKKLNQPIYFNLNKKTPEMSMSLKIDIPPNVQPETCDIVLSVGGDYIVPALDNLEKLVEMPTGCGEQNMVHFAPNILILQYLKATGEYRNEKKLVDTIKSYIEIGYQQQLSYRHGNGGYSVFGESIDKEASTWLTAYAVRFFIKAKKYIFIERRIIDTGLKYLSDAQLSNGSFPYTGYLFDMTKQNHYSLTAFILATFLEDHMYAKTYQHVIQKALQYLNSNLDDVSDLHALSIVAYVLQMAKNSNVNKVLQKLQIHRNEIDDLVWYSENDKHHGNNVIITSYILMTILDMNTPGDHVPILKWLIKQRNDKGGFYSTHDTVVGLQALVQFFQIRGDKRNANLDIKYTAMDRMGNQVQNGVLNIKTENFLKIQKEQLLTTTHRVNVEMSGDGSAFFQITNHYKVVNAPLKSSPIISNGTLSRHKYEIDNTTNDKIYFIIQPKAIISNENELNLEICFTCTTITNMVILKVNLLSGFRTDDESLTNLKTIDIIKRIEHENDYTVIVLYLDNVEMNVQNCIDILAYKASDVFNRKSAAIEMYNYYDKNIFNSKFYNV